MELQNPLLQRALQANAVFSLATGLVLALAGPTVSGWLGVSVGGWLRLLGVALIGHALILGVVGRLDDRPKWARINLALIAPYPLMMIGLVAFGLVERPLGVALVLLDGVIVGAIAIAHVLGLRERVPMTHAQVA